MSFDLKLENGDIIIGQDGELKTVINEHKLIQDILKMLFTATGENKAHPWYGTQLLSKAVGNAHDLELLASEVVASIEYGINNLRTLQGMQEQDGQFVTPREMIARVRDISVSLDQADSRKMVVSIQILTRSNDLISESFTVST